MHIFANYISKMCISVYPPLPPISSDFNCPGRCRLWLLEGAQHYLISADINISDSNDMLGLGWRFPSFQVQQRLRSRSFLLFWCSRWGLTCVRSGPSSLQASRSSAGRSQDTNCQPEQNISIRFAKYQSKVCKTPDMTVMKKVCTGSQSARRVTNKKHNPMFHVFSNVHIRNIASPGLQAILIISISRGA